MSLLSDPGATLRFLVGWFVPHSLVMLRWRALTRRREAARQRRVMLARQQEGPRQIATFDYGAAVDFLAGLGLDRSHVLEGSMPEASLEYCASFLPQAPQDAPVLGLHVGNFVGVSLAYFTAHVAALHPQSRMVSVDPNIPHRGIHDPTSAVIALLNHFCLEGYSLLLTGYSLEKNISNDGFEFDNYDPVARFAKEKSLTRVLDGLATFGRDHFHFCVLDGNHDRDYLRREIETVHALLTDGGVLLLDDVSAAWPELEDLFKRLDRPRFERLGTDGRVGIVRKIG